VSCEAESGYYTEETAATTIIANGTCEKLCNKQSPRLQSDVIFQTYPPVSVHVRAVFNVIAVLMETWQGLNT